MLHKFDTGFNRLCLDAIGWSAAMGQFSVVLRKLRGELTVAAVYGAGDVFVFVAGRYPVILFAKQRTLGSANVYPM